MKILLIALIHSGYLICLFSLCSTTSPKNTNSVLFQTCTVDGSHWLPQYFFSYIQWKSMATVNCLVTNILQNIFFCAQQKREKHTYLKQLEGEWIMNDVNFHFWVNYHFKLVFFSLANILQNQWQVFLRFWSKWMLWRASAARKNMRNLTSEYGYIVLCTLYVVKSIFPMSATF